MSNCSNFPESGRQKDIRECKEAIMRHYLRYMFKNLKKSGKVTIRRVVKW